MPDPMVLDLFAGPGGWDEGVRPLGLAPLGIEWDPDACATGTAAGHWRLQTDVAGMRPPTLVPVAGLIASPPCQGFSMAGKGRGREDTVHLLQSLDRVTTLQELEEDLLLLHATMADDRSTLALQPLRWALALRPGWLAWEQVPAVLPLWEACATVLRGHGYSVATSNVGAEQYGVPQTRKRAILVARSPELTAQLGPAQLPAPTHSRYHPRTPEKLDPGVAPWVSMAQALGRKPGHALRSNYGTGGDPAARGLRLVTQPAAAVTSKVDRNRWLTGDAYRRTAGGYVRVDENAPSRTIKPGNPRGASAGPRFDDVIRLPTDVEKLTTAQARELLGTSERHARVTVEEAAVLQSFPPDYPWQGNRTTQYRQIGDAVPPLLALHVVAAAAGLALPVSERAA